MYSINCQNRLQKMFVPSLLTPLETRTTGHPTLPTDFFSMKWQAKFSNVQCALCQNIQRQIGCGQYMEEACTLLYILSYQWNNLRNSWRNMFRLGNSVPITSAFICSWHDTILQCNISSHFYGHICFLHVLWFVNKLIIS